MIYFTLAVQTAACGLRVVVWSAQLQTILQENIVLHEVWLAMIDPFVWLCDNIVACSVRTTGLGRHEEQV